MGVSESLHASGPDVHEVKVVLGSTPFSGEDSSTDNSLHSLIVDCHDNQKLAGQLLYEHITLASRQVSVLVL